MKIACLGWGSLIWDPRGLPIRGNWFEDGPILPIEFARESGGKRVTLVIVEQGTLVRTLWALMSVVALEDAKAALAEREGISEENIKYSIGYWCSETETSHGRCEAQIGAWAKELGLDAVVWTNLKCGFRNARDKMPTYEQILDHLQTIDHEERQVAERYIRRAPVQIDTKFRRWLTRDFGWDPIET
ncbi:hypothetical protein [Halomonas ramblicola]|uniref:hypothetical protein n=1 Tax=Halomonas ramblicola TaxID=747349 RepID=UPI0025B41570|nr:hypothetical protein [Halomonas ramblicola]MDN3523086.1 hypothetical protein [Halomonas ramblicola]